MLDQTITVVFTNSHKLLAPAINVVTWSKYSHCAIVRGDRILQSTWGAGGVHETSLAALLEVSKNFTFKTFSVNNADAIYEAAASQVGKPYDKTALFGLPFHRDWQENDAWFCSELLAWAFNEGGTPLFNVESIHRITPGDIYKLHPTRIP